MNLKNVQNLIDIIGRFKDLKRSGWLIKKVINPESDAEHSFSVALLAMLLMPAGLDEKKCFKMALVHDLAEVYSGDYTPQDNITIEEKQAKEEKAIKKLAEELNDRQLEDIFAEYIKKNTKESIFINAIDKLDNVITASYYDKNNRAPVKLTPEFADYAQQKIDELENENLLQDIKEVLRQIV